MTQRPLPISFAGVQPKSLQRQTRYRAAHKQQAVDVSKITAKKQYMDTTTQRNASKAEEAEASHRTTPHDRAKHYLLPCRHSKLNNDNSGDDKRCA
jgi:hypothetical protein